MKQIKPKILNPKNFFKHLSSYQISCEEDLINWQSGRKINIQNNIKLLNLTKSNEKLIDNYDEKTILVFDQRNDIIGIAILDETLSINPKVVFNAIG